MANVQKYGSYDLETAEQEAADLGRSGADFKKLKVGRNVVRFLPPPIGKKSPFMVVPTHFINMPGAALPITFVCPRTAANTLCPVCEKADVLKRTGNRVDYDKAVELYPKRRVYANVIDREEPEKGVQILPFGKQIMDDLVKIRKDEDAGGDYTDPENGFDVIIERVGTGKNDTKYSVLAMRKQSPLGNPEWLDQQHDLDRFMKVPTVEEIETRLKGSTEPEPQKRIGSGRTADDDAQSV